MARREISITNIIEKKIRLNFVQMYYEMEIPIVDKKWNRAIAVIINKCARPMHKID